MKVPVKNTMLLAASGLSLLLLTTFGCSGQGDTDDGNSDAGVGDQFVADGGAGASIRIQVFNSVRTGGTSDFIVQVLDPRGEPIPSANIACDSERGLAILDPSAGGVAFGNTNGNGIMSGVLGGLTPGSWLLECRAEQGFNLVDRTTVVVGGAFPAGFDGFPGAAGGNLGGGLLVDIEEDIAPNPTVSDDPAAPDNPTITDIVFFDGADQTFFLDNNFITDCDGSTPEAELEPFFFKSYAVSFLNPLPESLLVQSVTFVVNNGSGATSIQQGNGIAIASNSTGTIDGPLTDTVGVPVTINVGQFFASTGVETASGTYNLTFTVQARGADSGTAYTFTDTAIVTFDSVNRC